MLVAGGSRGLTGAACLASLSAMRSGAGYVTALVPASLEAIFEIKLSEVMCRGLADDDGGHTPAGAAAATRSVLVWFRDAGERQGLPPVSDEVDG